jgi:hypothetical protein
MKKSQLETKKLKKEKKNKNSTICLLKQLLKWTTIKNLKIKNGLKSKLNMMQIPSSLKKPSKYLLEPYNLDSSKKIKRLFSLKSLTTSNKHQNLSKRVNHGLVYSKSSQKSHQQLQSKPTKDWLKRLLLFAMIY